MVGLLPVSRDGNNFPQWMEANKITASADKTLVAKYAGTYQPPQIDPKQAEATLLLVLNTKLDVEITPNKGFKISFKNKQSKWKNDNKTIEKIRGVLNGIIEERLNNIESYQNNKTIYPEHEEDDFDEIVSLLKVIKETKILISENTDKQLAINIEYVKQ